MPVAFKIGDKVFSPFIPKSFIPKTNQFRNYRIINEAEQKEVNDYL